MTFFYWGPQAADRRPWTADRRRPLMWMVVQRLVRGIRIMPLYEPGSIGLFGLEGWASAAGAFLFMREQSAINLKNPFCQDCYNQ